MFVPRAAVRPLLMLTFALTGFTALTLQVVWQRIIALHGGVDLYATTTVVAAFLGGLGVGSLLGGVLADRLNSRHCVLGFGAANAGIAAFSVASPWLFYDVYRQLEPALEGMVASFGFHVALLIVPTTLMGLSLPLLSRGLVQTAREIAPLVGSLYAINTIGAAAGAAVSGWWLLGSLGFVGTLRLAALGNLTAAVISAVLAAGRPVVAQHEPGDDPRVVAVGSEGSERPTLLGGRAWPWFVLYAVTGAVALGLEVVFFRVVDAVMRSNSYTFAHVLSLYLLLFGLGSAIGSRLVRRTRRPDAWFLWLQCAAGVGAVVGVLVLLAPLKLPDVGGVRSFLEEYFATDGLASGFQISRGQLLFSTAVAPLVVMALPVVCFGAAFPFIQAVVATGLDVLGRRTGALLFANVAGNVVGTLVTGFVLIDRLGTSGTLRLLGAVAVVPGIAAALSSSGNRRVPLAVGAVVAVAVPIAAFPSNRGMWALIQSAPSDEFVVVEERSCVTSLGPRGDGRLLFINGASQNGYPYDEFHVLIGLLPSLLHRDPARGLAVGLGMGGTTFGMALDRRIDSVETVEICGGQVELIEHLARSGTSPESGQLLSDDRLDIRIGDGRKRLLQTEEHSLDVVTVDTLRPQSGYSGNLYSREFYELVRSRLAVDGVFAQWIATPRTLETMKEVFPHLQLWSVEAYFGSRFAVASRSPMPYDRTQLRDRFDSVDLTPFPPPLADSLRQYFARTEPEILQGGQPAAPDHRNEDLVPRDEYFLNNGY
ncbi:MAG: fused MFS/spermidine synthase [Actinomycetota bacterium]|nr:fused MFS/spermidine synthase [Actinomycetota bacterium]